MLYHVALLYHISCLAKGLREELEIAHIFDLES